MVYLNDDTVLTEPDQTDWWSIQEVLFFFFLMYNDWKWWAALLLSYFYDFVQTLPFVNNVSATEGLIVNPTQALIGIITFEFFKYYKIVDVVCKIPSIADDWTEWKNYLKCYAYFLLVVPVILFVKPEENDWIVAIGFVCMALVRFFIDRNNLFVVFYVLSYSGLVIGLNRVPYNPFYASLYFHAVFVVWFLILLVIEIYTIWKDSRGDIFPQATTT